MARAAHPLPSDNRLRGGGHRSARLVAACAVVIASTTLGAHSAAAAPLTGVPVAGTSYAGVSVQGSAGQPNWTRQLPIPAGLTPTALTATVHSHLPAGRQAAVIVGSQTVLQPVGGQLANVAADSVSQVSIPLTAADLVATGSGQSATIPVSIAVVNADGSPITCAVPEQTAELSDIALTFAGTATAPASIADFFGNAVQHVTVLVPPDGDLTSASGPATGALQAVASLTHLYARQAVQAGGDLDIQVVAAAAAPAGADPAVSRVLSLSPGSGAVTATLGTDPAGVPLLRLTGGAEELAAAASALDDDLMALAAGTTATGLVADVRPPSAQSTWTLADLTGSTQLNLSGYGQSSSYIGVQQASFGGPVDQLDLHLAGMADALPTSSTARLSVIWNGMLVSSTMVGDGAPFSIDVAVPSGQVTRDNSMLLRLDAVSDGGCESAVLPAQVWLDATASTITGRAGQGLDAGFTRFPQVLAGLLPVALGTSGAPASLLTQAAHYVSALQSMTSVPLAVEVVGIGDLIDGGSAGASGLIVGPSPEQVDLLHAPLRMAEFRQISTFAEGFGAGVDAPFAALQAFGTGSRDLLVAAGWAPVGADAADTGLLMDALATAADTPAGTVGAGWSALSGSLLVSTADGVAPLSPSMVVPQAAVVAEHTGLPVAVWATGGALILLGLARAFFVSGRRRAARRFVDRIQPADADKATVTDVNPSAQADPAQLELIGVGRHTGGDGSGS